MPFKPVGQVKCPACGKSVYAAEERAVGELKFHKECYKCSMCNKYLDSTNMNCHETVLFCKTCHGRKYGPKGYGFGGGAAGLSMDTGAHLEYGRDDFVKEYKAPKAEPGTGCPRCGGKVFAAEEMLARGKQYHRTCFNCKTCRKPLDSTLHCDGPDNEVYCKVCYGTKFGPKGYGYGQGAGTLQTRDPEANPIVRPHGDPEVMIMAKEGEEGCPRCGGKVYSAELMLAKGRPFHKKCFKCLCCKRPLDSMTHCDGQDGEIYCKLCYAKKYGPKGYGFAAGAGGVLTAENIPGGEAQSHKYSADYLDLSAIKAKDGEGCPRCGGKVFMAEEMFARGKSWHKRCFNCCHCKRPLDSVVGCDAPDGEIYCNLCYAKRFGPKGYGFAAGAGGVLSAANLGGDETKVGDQRSAYMNLDVSKIQANKGEGCPRCGGKVFMAEEVHVRDRSWHKKCYSCCNCKRPLDSVVGCDSPDGEVYCKLCYAKKYGPKGYGFSAGAGGILTAENIPGGRPDDVKTALITTDTTSILAAPGEGCPRCGGKVFSAEEQLSRHSKWHKSCYSCCDCHRPLDSMVLCDGPDKEIYCKLCYAKKFGPKGYGFASGCGGVLYPEAITVDDENQTYQTNPSTYITPSIKNIAPAKEGQARCPRCGGAVFQAESMCSRNKEWHKQCFTCCECRRPLDSMIGCDAPDGEIYCKLCYAKKHGPKGYGYGQTAALVSLGTEDGTPVPADIRQFGFQTGQKVREFLETQVNTPMTTRTEQIKTVIVNQIKNLPVSGRVPRGGDEPKVDQAWIKDENKPVVQSRGFSGFPSIIKTSSSQPQEGVTITNQSQTQKGETTVTMKQTTRTEVQESSSSSIVQTSSSSVTQAKQEVGKEQDDVNRVEVEEEAPRLASQQLPSSVDSEEEEEEEEEEEVVPTIDSTSQTSSLPQSDNETFLPNDPANVTPEMSAQMNAVQQQMQQQIQQQMDMKMQQSESQQQNIEVSRVTEEVNISMQQEQHMVRSSQESHVTTKVQSNEVVSESKVEASEDISSEEVIIGDSSESEIPKAASSEMDESGKMEVSDEMEASEEVEDIINDENPIPAEYEEEEEEVEE